MPPTGRSAVCVRSRCRPWRKAPPRRRSPRPCAWRLRSAAPVASTWPRWRSRTSILANKSPFFYLYWWHPESALDRTPCCLMNPDIVLLVLAIAAAWSMGHHYAGAVVGPAYGSRVVRMYAGIALAGVFVMVGSLVTPVVSTYVSLAPLEGIYA